MASPRAEHALHVVEVGGVTATLGPTDAYGWFEGDVVVPASVVVDGPEPLRQALEQKWAAQADGGDDGTERFHFDRVVADSCGVSMGVSSGLRLEATFNRTEVTMRMVLDEVEAAGWAMSHVTGGDMNTTFLFTQK